MDAPEMFRQIAALRHMKLVGAPLPHRVVIPEATYTPWDADRQFLEAYEAARKVSVVDIYRLWELWELARRPAAGDVLEVGVYRGGSALLLGQALQGRGRLYLADTFSGVVKAGANDSRYRGGEFSDTSAGAVRTLMAGIDCELLVGIFPEATSAKIDTCRFQLCHIDVDTYQSAKDTFEWVWPRLNAGGVVIFDDCGFFECDGVTKAWNEIAVGLKLYNLNGHGIVVKVS